MYLLSVDIRPTAALTFRILPGSILDITTYPFVPPTTLSGFLRRLAMLAAGVDVPGTAVDDAPYYVLPPSLVALGAYPLLGLRGKVHRTHRKGMKDFTDTSFTRIRVAGKEQPTFQLHTWEYLITDRLRGYIVTEDSSAFESLRQIQGYGCKLGKEGFAYVEEVTGPIELQRAEQSAPPATVVPAASVIDAAPDCPFDLYTLYSFVWQEGQEASQPDSDQRSPVRGYKPFSAAWCAEGKSIPLEYLSTGALFIPYDLVKTLRGEGL
jgi:hypothetical protein